MKRGLVLGKFMPLHNGHISLIEFAANNCDELIVLICATKDEPIKSEFRVSWIANNFINNSRVKPHLLQYDEISLPNTSESSKEVSRLWANYLKSYIPHVDVIFTSEPYGEYMGEFLNCDFVIFDMDRKKTPVSATQIRDNPFEYWGFIPDVVRPYFTKKICLYGSESTGKTTLTGRLAEYYQTAYVPEMAREILEKTDDCTEQHLIEIAELQAATINKKLVGANKLLFVDTDINITRSYSRFLFKKELAIPRWVEEVNQFDLYLYLDIDAPFIQDGTRLSKKRRNLLDQNHKLELETRGIKYQIIKGNWEERFNMAISVIDSFINKKYENITDC
jgi:HTH-type transcriptional repressor of NAD biosynthesis genes